MGLELIGITVLWLFLFLYVIVGSIDYGAGVFNAHSILTNKQHILSKVIQRYLSPVWEVTNVFFVFFVVGIIGFFPDSAFYFGSILLIPASVSIILLALRGSYYAFESYGAKGHKGYAFMYGATGIFIPASLSVVLTISEGGFVSFENGVPVLDYTALLTSPLTWSIVVLSLVAVLYISSVFLTWYAHKTGDMEATALMRKYAIIWSVPLIVAAGGIIFELRNHNIDHFESIMQLWWMFAISFVLWALTLRLIWLKRHFGAAVWLMIFQFMFAFFGYGISHYPYLLYPHLTIYDGFTNEAMAISLIVVFILGMLLLLPSLYLLLRLFLFDKKYVKGKRE
ncbi:cytochrome d ubiquinol oxidase subunit II [Halalkalibacterium halodurans]|uniref:cytochrome d ubiquinol oxidase subunit II n=1 Tax=Halalkalibacterium halodurans TaxID=86665 RepID=UPI0010685C5A|nr:cytochrome d ubiquinol oxidase subunit II [Halalkalibacterium halodurans]TES56523.1 cytochrome d ubiquinol oxidase subunit II [Halalkalibacterium halodurans]